MRGRLVGLVVVGVLALVGGCARPPAQPRVVLPTGVTVVAEWIDEGGFVAPASIAIRGPRLTVYSDGTAIADAARTLTLPADELSALIADLRRDLDGLNGNIAASGGMSVTDMPDAVLRLLRPDGSMQVVRAYGLTVQRGYPAGLEAAGTRLRALSELVGTSGTSFRADRVRVVAEQRDDLDSAATWPADVPVPTLVTDAYADTVYIDTATPAGPVEAAWPGGDAPTAGWPTARLPSGTVVSVSWRYLLPTE